MTRRWLYFLPFIRRSVSFDPEMCRLAECQAPFGLGNRSPDEVLGVGDYSIPSFLCQKPRWRSGPHLLLRRDSILDVHPVTNGLATGSVRRVTCPYLSACKGRFPVGRTRESGSGCVDQPRKRRASLYPWPLGHLRKNNLSVNHYIALG